MHQHGWALLQQGAECGIDEWSAVTAIPPRLARFRLLQSRKDVSQLSRRIAAALLLLVACGESPSSAHAPSGSSVAAFQFPDLLVPVIDGDLSDWAVVGEAYVINTNTFVDLVNSVAVDTVDFSVVAMVGWNRSLNRMYVAARVVDDIHQIDRPSGSAGSRIFQDDAMEIFIDADHSGGQYANFAELSAEEQLLKNGASASHFVLAGPPPDDDFFVNFSARRLVLTGRRTLHDGRDRL